MTASSEPPAGRDSEHEPDEPPRSTEHGDGLVIDRLLDRLDAVRVLRERDHHASEAALEAIGVSGPVEQLMLEEVGDLTPLAHPDRFWDAHRTLMRALEVFDRNGARAPIPLPIRGPFRPLTPLAAILVQLMIRTQVRSHQIRVINDVRRLYGRREATCVLHTQEFALLRMARKQMTRLTDDYRDGKSGFAGLVVVAAALSSTSAVLTSILDVANRHWWVWVVIGTLLVTVALGASWVILNAAAIARRRSRIALDTPIAALLETIGHAGEPPRDPTKQFVVFALIALVVGWLTAPILIAILLL